MEPNALLQTLATFPQHVDVMGQNSTQAVRDLAQQLHTTTEATAAQIMAVVQNVAAAQAPRPAPELQLLVQTLQQLPAAFQQAQQAQQPPRPTLKLDPPSFNGRSDFRDWRRKLELVYDAKQLSAQERLTWTLAILQDGASRVATQENPTSSVILSV